MKRITSGTAHDGTSNAFAKPGEATLAIHHDPNLARTGDHGVKGNIARNGALKRMHPVSIHNGMTERQQALQGMGHATAVAPDANPANPMSKEPQGKRLAPVAVSPAMRSRTAPHDAALGVAILDAALKN